MVTGDGVSRQVLVVDDQKGVRRLLEEALGQAGLEVESVGTGMEALRKVESCRYGLILLDMKMPGMNGIELLAEFHKRGIHVPVWLMTAYGELDIMQEAYRLGAEQHVIKPFDVVELSQRVRQMMNQHMAV